MNSPLKYTSLDYVEDLVKAGFNEKQSKAQAKALFRVIEQNAVTKQDLKELEVKLSELEVKLSHDIQNVQRDLKELELKIAHEMKELGSSLFVKLSIATAGMLTLSISIMGLLIHFLR